MSVTVRRVLGVVAVVLGIVMIIVPYAGLVSSTESIPNRDTSGEGLQVTPTFFGGGTLAVRWTGAGPSTIVTLYSCPSGGCGSGAVDPGSLALVSRASGTSGSFSGDVTGGHPYLLVQNGTAGNLAVTVAPEGFGILSIIAVVLLALGGVLAAWPSREPAPVTSDDTPGENETVLAAPASARSTTVTMTPARGPTSAPSTPPPAAAGPSEEEHLYQASEEDEAASTAAPSSAVASGGSKREAVKCGNCGTMNEPWITNCRWCKRPLGRTG